MVLDDSRFDRFTLAPHFKQRAKYDGSKLPLIINLSTNENAEILSLPREDHPDWDFSALISAPTESRYSNNGRLRVEFLPMPRV